MVWVLLAVCCVAAGATVGGQQNVPGLKIDDRSIGGTVVNSNGAKPEAGVWVIAETKSLPTPFRKIVVTDDQGRYLVPDLPKGDYELWVRGYGLKDSAHVKGARGGNVKLQVADAATAAGSGEDLSRQLLDVDDSAAPDERASGQVQESGRMARNPEERVQPLPRARHAANAHLYHRERLGRDVPARPVHAPRTRCDGQSRLSRRCWRIGAPAWRPEKCLPLRRGQPASNAMS
jgi:hypothetical protein